MFSPGEQSLSGHFKVKSEETTNELAQSRHSMHTGWRKVYLNENVAPELGCGWFN